MSAPLRAFWWSPRRDPRTMLSELRHNGAAWGRLALPLGRAGTNHGDELSALVLEEATGRRVQWAPLGREDVVAVGSILVPYLRHGGTGRIWGTGVHTPEISGPDAARIADRVLAIRGPHARTALGLADNTPLGDPGLIVRSMPRRRRARAGTVLVTHFLSYRNASERSRIRAARAAGIRVLPPTLAPRDIIDEIASADHVLSAGMHGVILAHALRTPATLVSLRTPHPARVAFKYRDYLHSVGLPARAASWASAADPVWRRALLEQAATEVECIDARVDGLVDGLFAAAAPLRSGH